MRRMILALCALPLLAARGAEAQPNADSTRDSHWIYDAAHCKVYNPVPKPNESVSWSGQCVDGIASGDGTLTWFLAGHLRSRYEGPLIQGLPDGVGSDTYANGDRYEGEFYQGAYDGHGSYTFANGAKYEGDFVHGTSTRSGTLTLKNGQTFKTDLIAGRQMFASPRHHLPKNLYVICFGSDEVFESLTPVRLSTIAGLDHEAEMDLMNIARGGFWQEDNTIVSKPIAGCHMVGFSFEPGEYVISFNRGPED